ncbi:protein-disulfide reductase DsbD domain-containing protein [Mangrovimonas sp. TPBH4]|uniref:protein-disulfide reductase DsbD domain-containing protein n=1 Tax=Mangrovimonas sp. TPBH4 TaxID=1645914 RepID=UPI0006B53811|nr:protein-disulfide reductase DsbD domain-containing protein [Mangrovimonas sp. TPBH4]
MNCFLNSKLFFIGALGIANLINAQTQWVQIQDTIYQVQKGKNTVELEFFISEGYHIQANTNVLDWVSPSVLNMETIDALTDVTVCFPESHEIFLEGIEDPLKVFSNRLLVKVEFSISRITEPSMLWKGSLWYQACDDKQCFYPRNLPVTLRLNLD